VQYHYWYRDKCNTMEIDGAYLATAVDRQMVVGSVSLRERKDLEYHVRTYINMEILTCVGEGFPLGNHKKPSRYMVQLMKLAGLSFSTVRNFLWDLGYQKTYDTEDAGRAYCVRVL